MTTAEKLAALEARVAASAVLLEEIHIAVCGNGSAGSSLRERTAALEAGNDWKHKLLAAAVPTVLSTLLAHAGLPIPQGGHS